MQASESLILIVNLHSAFHEARFSGEHHVRRKQVRTFHESAFPDRRSGKSERARGKARASELLAVVQQRWECNVSARNVAAGGGGETETKEKIRSVIKRRTI